MGIKVLVLFFIGLGGGIAVGSGLVAFLTVLGIVPRLMQLSKTYEATRSYEWSIISGSVLGGWMILAGHTLSFPAGTLLLVPIGLFCGVFVGMLAAALTEVLNVLPILAKRVGFGQKILLILMAIVLGKISGSLFHWIYYVNH
ncbi:stage V sporulation protein AB [Fictibacillus aquaticus]|uniref:Stage V sporulation protein AB n=1 Tax=Fictibacillus aquaticus TaxID=2021314 RepID=A0A235FAP5_9BACL|nr:stage V sporulation protein AB [Fictibacillus aquaticus]OYD58398.1 stage V sporulation protein AB [Fictibacillus aquaticus]